MCANRGFKLEWNFDQFSAAAHHSATGLKEHIYAHFPLLYSQEPVWDVLYREKKEAFLDLVKAGRAQLMPGVTELLSALEQAALKRCVVTHSPLSVIELIRDQNPLLQSIPHWITRENYTHPKPHPECYQLAITQLAEVNDQIIGFEDSPRGLTALQQTKAKAVLICPEDYPYSDDLRKSNATYYPNFQAINDTNAP